MITSDKVRKSLESTRSAPPSDEDLAYFAGAIDGEGCILISKALPKKKSPIYKLSLTAANTDPNFIFYLNTIFPSYINNAAHATKQRRNTYSWGANGDYACEILRLIYPFLIIKKEQASIAIEFQKTFNNYYGYFGVPNEILLLREKLFIENKRLKTIEWSPIT